MAGVEATWELHTLGTALQIICYQITVRSLLNKWQFQKDRGNVLPYSLDITPPSFISPPFHFARIRCEGIFISNLSPPDHGRTLRTTLYRVQRPIGQRYTDQAIGYATTGS